MAELRVLKGRGLEVVGTAAGLGETERNGKR